MARITRFNFKNLDVYAALSIPANIAEANGRDRQPGEAEQHYRYAQGSTYESAAFLDALAILGAVSDDEYNQREEALAGIASMLAQLMRKQARRR